MRRDELPTLPPTDAELEALASFELLMQEAGELDARYAYTSLCLDELMHPAQDPL